VLSRGQFLLLASVILVLAAPCLALAGAFDSSLLAVAGALFVLAIFVAREAWLWRGGGRQRLILMGAIGGAIVVAFLAEKVFG
jgi:hypothetical protein